MTERVLAMVSISVCNKNPQSINRESYCHGSGKRTHRIRMIKIVDQVACCIHGDERYDQQINYSSGICMYSIHLG